jgi:hypothetical protein
LHIGIGFRLDPDVWQAYQSEKRQKIIRFRRYMQKNANCESTGIAAKFFVDCRISAPEESLQPQKRQKAEVSS